MSFRKWSTSDQGNRGEGEFKTRGLKTFHNGHLFVIGLINVFVDFFATTCCAVQQGALTIPKRFPDDPAMSKSVVYPKTPSLPPILPKAQRQIPNPHRHSHRHFPRRLAQALLGYDYDKLRPRSYHPVLDYRRRSRDFFAVEAAFLLSTH